MKKDKFYFGIFNSWDLINPEIRKDVREWLAEDRNLSPDDVKDDWIDESIMEQLECEKTNLDIETGGYILAFANVGLWSGRVTGYRKVGSNVSDVLSHWYGGDDCEWYADRYNVRAIAYHHDGRNYMVFRYVEDEDKLSDLCEKIYDGKIRNEHDLFKVTKSIRPFVSKVYGWKNYGRQNPA